jgi:hypothetical protein
MIESAGAQAQPRIGSAGLSYPAGSHPEPPQKQTNVGGAGVPSGMATCPVPPHYGHVGSSGPRRGASEANSGYRRLAAR